MAASYSDAYPFPATVVTVTMAIGSTLGANSPPLLFHRRPREVLHHRILVQSKPNTSYQQALDCMQASKCLQEQHHESPAVLRYPRSFREQNMESISRVKNTLQFAQHGCWNRHPSTRNKDTDSYHRARHRKPLLCRQHHHALVARKSHVPIRWEPASRGL